MEIPRSIKAAEFGLAVAIFAGSYLGLQRLEQESQRPRLIASGHNVKVYAACQDTPALYQDFPPQEGYQSIFANLGINNNQPVSFLIRAQNDLLQIDASARRPGSIGKLQPVIYYPDLVGIYKVGAQVIATPNTTPFIDNGEQDSVLIEEVSGRFICPSHVANEIISFIASPFQDLSNRNSKTPLKNIKSS